MNPPSVEGTMTPLFVDLDGSLIATDSLWESLILLLKEKPLYFLWIPLWILKGKQYFKKHVTDATTFDSTLLPYRRNVLNYIHIARNEKRRIVLATAADERIASGIATFIGMFDEVIATNENINLSGKNKLLKIKELTNNGEFDYIGNSSADFPIWKEARRAIVVSSSNSFINKVRSFNSTIEVLPPYSPSRIGVVLKTMRVHQWIKNLLLFVPLLLAHRVSESDTLLKTFIAFFSFSLCASSVYILNDIFDLESDRRHPRKKNRPFASGIVQIPVGIILVPLLLAISSLLAFFYVSWDFTLALWTYSLLTSAYSFRLKKIAILDVLLLAGLYSFRLFAGSVAGSVFLSPWLIAFAIFLFLSLAFVKRYSELLLAISENNFKPSGRGYYATDIEIVQSVGMASGLISVLVFALYMNSREVSALYHHPQLLWLVGMCLLYWIIRVWLIAHRGEMHDDPIIFTVKDKTSYLIGIILIGIMVAATF
jgi:4-hydroxybenzoate polyprenyltransferase